MQKLSCIVSMDRLAGYQSVPCFQVPKRPVRWKATLGIMVSTVCSAITLLTSAAAAQNWDLYGCDMNAIVYPVYNGRNGYTFPEGSCPPPTTITLSCPDGCVELEPDTVYAVDFETYYDHNPTLAIDDHMMTRWSANNYSSDTSWIYVDLGTKKAFNRVYLTWETARAEDYVIQVSDNATQWETVATINGSDGFIDTVDISDAEGRYVKMRSVKRANPSYSVSLFDITICALQATKAPVMRVAPKAGGIQSSVRGTMLQLTVSNPEVAHISIIDVTGRIVRQQSVSTGTGNQSIPLNVKELSNGVYLVKASIGKEVITQTMILSE